MSHRHEGDDHQVMSLDHEVTTRHLTQLGAQNIQENRMTIDDIAVQILKRGNHVANS